MAAAAAPAADWPGWRGPDRSGVSPETGLLDRWPEGGPELVWKVENAGEGYSSVAIAGGRVYTMGNRDDGREYVIAYSEESPRELWAYATGPGYRNGRGNGPRSTPVVEGGLVYAEGARGELVCLEAESGRKVWGFNILERFGGKNIGWGLSESPLVEGDLLIVSPGARDASVVALDRMTGEVRWRSPGERPGYASPILTRGGGVEQVVVFNDEVLAGIRLRDGKRLWSYDRVANDTANVATPIVRDDFVYATSDYGVGCALLRLRARTSSEVDAEEVYFNRDMKNHHGGVVLVGDYVYGFSGSILTCMEFETGRVRWRNRSVGKGSLIAADGKLYILSERGVAALAGADPEAYRERGRFEIGRGRWPTWAHPALANGRLYLRRDGTILGYRVR